jgi:hypothetical protein
MLGLAHTTSNGSQVRVLAHLPWEAGIKCCDRVSGFVTEGLLRAPTMRRCRNISKASQALHACAFVFDEVRVLTTATLIISRSGDFIPLELKGRAPDAHLLTKA